MPSYWYYFRRELRQVNWRHELTKLLIVAGVCLVIALTFWWLRPG